MDRARVATSGWRVRSSALVSESAVRVPDARGPDSEILDSSRPVMLVVHLGDDDLGRTGQRGQGRGARATVVDDGRDPFEQRLQVGLADGQAVGGRGADGAR